MLFNSSTFLIFFVAVLALCVLIRFTVKTDSKIRWRNGVLLLASYYFYAFLKWEFLLLLLATTSINYVAGLQIGKYKDDPRKKRFWMWTAVVFSVGILAYFKYTNFFIDSINQALSLIGMAPRLPLLKIILPVGISFFTFQALTYTLDIYHGKIQARRSFLDVALFVSFFPTILSGPIEKARNLLPQLEAETQISLQSLLEGGKRFLWGLFKKIVIADRLADIVNMVYYTEPGNFSSLTLMMAVVFYSFQIYADFSGYSDMAIGIAQALGFRLKENFYYPYFSTSVKDFWKRWHISLTSWFSEYIYIPLGGNRVSRARWVFNIAVVFLVSGFWHGAKWAFIIWGGLHAAYYLVEFFLNRLRPSSFKPLPFWVNACLKCASCLLVFGLVSVAWIFFRLEDSGKAWEMLVCMFRKPEGIYLGASVFSSLLTILLLSVFLLIEWIRYKEYKLSWIAESVIYAVILCMVLLFGVTTGGFVYFQF